MNESPPQKTRTGFATDAMQVFRGLCMGCADVVPGVSGGTVALILGIYERLVTSISRIDRQFFALCRQRRWLAVAEHLDLRFLIALAAGIGTGVVGMSLIVNRLLTNPTSRAITLAAFFGMILASAVILARLIRPGSPAEGVRAAIMGFAAALLSFRISLLDQLSGAGDPSYPWFFLCGAIGICAMILPGISGAMILLVLGAYVHLTEVPHNLIHGEHIGQSLTTLVVFGSGCATGLILFSKVLRWLLSSYHVTTMSILCGLMVGALVKLWPFQHDLTPQVEKFKYKELELYWPDQIDRQAMAVIAAAVIAIIIVFVTDYLVRRQPRSS
jgi:putative membrane protein